MSNKKEFDPPSFDYTFCSSKNCKNKCGRKMSKRLKDIWAKEKRQVAFADFCESEEE